MISVCFMATMTLVTGGPVDTPSGPVGPLMAGGIALLYAKAMVETRGILPPTLMHMLTDVAIYLFLALAALGK
ncbi:MAG: hypothetical protein R2911_34510 [Caldilineaceae bacterium]